MKVMDVREATRFARDYALRNGPIILEMITYRYYGHSLSDPGVSYRSREEVKKIQAERDPIELFVKLLVENGVRTEAEILVRISFLSFLSLSFLPSSRVILSALGDKEEYEQNSGRRNGTSQSRCVSRNVGGRNGRLRETVGKSTRQSTLGNVLKKGQKHLVSAIAIVSSLRIPFFVSAV